MFNRPHHKRIAKILQSLNCDLLLEAECYFAGGTAIVLTLGEYRESVDIDFLCASREGYRLLRNTVTDNTLGRLLTTPLKHIRDVHTDRYAIRTFLEIENTPVKIEFVREDRITLDGDFDTDLRVPKLSCSDMFAEKLLANADRGLDRFVKSRDIIDLAMMIDAWGNIPKEAITKVFDAYDNHVFDALKKSVDLIHDEDYFKSCLQAAHMDERMAEWIPKLLKDQLNILNCSTMQSMGPC